MEQSIRVWKKYGPWLLLVLLAVSLIPVLLLGRYGWPSADDYSYALLPHEAMLNGECLLSGSWHAMWHYYKGWQGTFTAIGLMSLTPLTFSEYLYWITPVVMLASLCAGTFKLADTLVRRALGGTWRQTVFLAVPILLLSIQFVVSPKDTFYWWNGAVYYTFTYGIMLLLVERLVALKLAQTRRQILWAVIPGTLAALLVGGSNYVSALLATLVCGLFLLYFLWRERKKALPAPVVTPLKTVTRETEGFFSGSLCFSGRKLLLAAPSGNGAEIELDGKRSVVIAAPLRYRAIAAGMSSFNVKLPRKWRKDMTHTLSYTVSVVKR